MHTRIIESANLDQLKEYLTKELYKVKERDFEMYEELELDLYKEVYGYHFNEWLLEKALSCMRNEDGTNGGHWTLEQTSSVAKGNNVEFVHFNEYDWCYVMNMMYSDYYKAGGNNTSFYVELTKAFLCDKDAPDGKALKYYLAMKD